MRDRPELSRRAVLAAAGLPIVSGAAGLAALAEERPLRAADNQSIDFPTVQALLFMDRAIRARTGNELRMRVFASGQLGEERETIEQTRRGVIDIARVNASLLAGIVPELQALLMPYLFRSMEHLRAVIDGKIGADLLDSVKPHGFIGLAFYDSGIRSIYNRTRPVRGPSDLAGMRIRVQQVDLAATVLSAMGATPIQLPYSQVLPALDAGLIDGAENNFPSYLTTDHATVARYFSPTEHMAPPEIVLVSELSWRRMSGEHRDAVASAALDSRFFMRKLWDHWTDLTLRQAAAVGVEFETKVDRAAFARSTEPVYASLGAGSRVAEFVERIRAIP